MFGVAIELKPENFHLLLKQPKPIFVGLLSQFLFLPAITFGFIQLIEPSPGIALGMMLVAACPGGNVSNFFSILSKGNVALSVSITVISSSLAVVLTPVNFAFWSGLYEPTRLLLQTVSLNIYGMVLTIIFVLLIPLLIGMFINGKWPNTTKRYSRYIRIASIFIFSCFIIIALSANFDYFLRYISIILIIVFLHNAMAVATGYFTAKVSKLNEGDKRSIAIETGIQNSGLALVLIFDFFNGLGSMAIIAAWWGIWHLLSGFLLSWYWSKR